MSPLWHTFQGQRSTDFFFLNAPDFGVWYLRGILVAHELTYFITATDTVLLLNVYITYCKVMFNSYVQGISVPAMC